MSDSTSIRCLLPDMPQAEQLLPYLHRIDDARWYTNFGPLNREYETTVATELSRQEDRELWVATAASGGVALELALQALALAPGSAVLTPALGFPATPAAIIRQGLVPVFGDIDVHSWCLTPEIARTVLTRRPLAAVLPVTTYGFPLATAEWQAFQEETGIPVIVDAASNLGRQTIGRLRAVVFSLHATKPLGCGEGGVIASADGHWLEQVRRLSNFGFDGAVATTVAGNGKLSEYAAAIALAQWQRREMVWTARERVWQDYRAALEPVLASGARLQPHGVAPGNLVLRLPVAALPVATALASQGIETRRWYCPPLHRHPAFSTQAREPLPVTEALAGHLLGLPFHAGLDAPAITRVARALADCLRSEPEAYSSRSGRAGEESVR